MNEKSGCECLNEIAMKADGNENYSRLDMVINVALLVQDGLTTNNADVERLVAAMGDYDLADFSEAVGYIRGAIATVLIASGKFSNVSKYL